MNFFSLSTPGTFLSQPRIFSLSEPGIFLSQPGNFSLSAQPSNSDFFLSARGHQTTRIFIFQAQKTRARGGRQPRISAPESLFPVSVQPSPRGGKKPPAGPRRTTNKRVFWDLYSPPNFGISGAFEPRLLFFSHGEGFRPPKPPKSGARGPPGGQKSGFFRILGPPDLGFLGPGPGRGRGQGGWEGLDFKVFQ